MSTSIGRRLVALIPWVLLAASDADAAQRTFVSTAGNDANVCSLPAPCRTFGTAMGHTDAGGEIVVLDSGGYGAVTISQAVTIVAPPGVYAGISVFGGTGVTVNPGSGKVTLRGLTINALGGSTGILYQSGDALYVDNVVVSGFSGGGGIGLSAVTAPTPTNLFVQDSTFRDNATGLMTASTTGLTLVVERTVFERNGIGADLQGAAKGAVHGSTFSGGATGLSAGQSGAATAVRVELRDCTVSDNSGIGVAAIASSSATVSVVSSLISGNATGIQATNSTNSVYASDNTITRNTTGISATASATIVSGSDNRLINNGANGSFTSTTPKL